MKKQSKIFVVEGRKPQAKVVVEMQAAGELREATTGGVVGRVWAVAAPQPVRQPSTRTRQLENKANDRLMAPTAAEELGFYRKYTEALLRRYVQLTMEAGRVSSVMGREVIGGKASSYRIHAFDDAVIFRLDVEKCFKKLNGEDREIVRRVGIQQYTQQEAAEVMGLSLRTVWTRYAKAIDRLTGILLEARLLEPMELVKWQ